MIVATEIQLTSVETRAYQTGEWMRSSITAILERLNHLVAMTREEFIKRSLKALAGLSFRTSKQSPKMPSTELCKAKLEAEIKRRHWANRDKIVTAICNKETDLEIFKPLVLEQKKLINMAKKAGSSEAKISELGAYVRGIEAHLGIGKYAHHKSKQRKEKTERSRKYSTANPYPNIDPLTGEKIFQSIQAENPNKPAGF